MNVSILSTKTFWGGFAEFLSSILLFVNMCWPNVIHSTDVVPILAIVTAFGGLVVLVYGRIDASSNGKIVTLTGAPPSSPPDIPISTNPHSAIP